MQTPKSYSSKELFDHADLATQATLERIRPALCVKRVFCSLRRQHVKPDSRKYYKSQLLVRHLLGFSSFMLIAVSCPLLRKKEKQKKEIKEIYLYLAAVIQDYCLGLRQMQEC